MNYRSEIDGLRALAVLSVIIFHINAQWLTGGFLGVDIFFVISGFLITSIIYQEIQANNFSFAVFYMRRIKRILPVFFTVIISGLLLDWFLFEPNDRRLLSRMAIASVGFIANFHTARHDNYFDISSMEKPFLHIWSLSIEEQFYFIFPLLLLAILKFTVLKRNKLKILIALAILSVLSSFINTEWNKYYLLHLRAVELLTGSILAIYLTDKNKSPNAQSLLSTIGFIGIIFCFFLYHENIDFFPGVMSLPPSIFTAFLLMNNNQKNLVNRFLSLRFVVWIGKLSYSLYLWHWLVLAFMRYIYGQTTLPSAYILLAVCLTFLLSCLSYYFIEQPIRRKSYSFKKSFILLYLLPALTTIVLATAISQESKRKQSYLTELETSHYGCTSKIEGSCLVGDTTQPINILVVGDSHSDHLAPFLDKIGKQEHWQAEIAPWEGGCPFLFNYTPSKVINDGYKCILRNQQIAQKYLQYPIIILSNNWLRSYRNTVDFETKFNETLQRLVSSGKKIYVINSSSNVQISPTREYYLKHIGIYLNHSSSMSDITNKSDDAIAKVAKITQRYPGIRWIDLRIYIPKDFYIDGKPVLKDTHHWNSYGAEKIADRLMQKGKFITE